MFTIRETETYSEWIDELRDRRAQAVIDRRVSRMEQGNFGDSKSVGEQVSELRINFGPGYRVYYTRKGGEVVILLCGGDKDSQQSDIKLAKQLAKEVHDAD